MHSSATLTFTLSCSRHLRHIQNFSSSQTETLPPLNTESPSPPPALATSILLSVSVTVTTPGTSYEWNHAALVLWCLAYFTPLFHAFLLPGTWAFWVLQPWVVRQTDVPLLISRTQVSVFKHTPVSLVLQLSGMCNEAILATSHRADSGMTSQTASGLSRSPWARHLCSPAPELTEPLR